MRVGPTQGLLIGFAAVGRCWRTPSAVRSGSGGATTLLITSLRPVLPGTEGGELEGTAASALGSLLMTLVVVVWIDSLRSSGRRRGCGWVHCHPAREPLALLARAVGPGSAMSSSMVCRRLTGLAMLVVWPPGLSS